MKEFNDLNDKLSPNNYLRLNGDDIETKLLDGKINDLAILKEENIELSKENEFECIKNSKYPDIAYIESSNRNELLISNKKLENSSLESFAQVNENEIKNLTVEEKNKIKEETGWSDEIINKIENWKQYQILKNADLKECNINGKICLIKNNIDLDYTDADGISNRDRIKMGLAPIDSKSGKPLELHHLGQKSDSPLVELTEKEHRTGEYENGKKNQSLWHDNSKVTEVHGEGNTWNQERKDHWLARYEASLED